VSHVERWHSSPGSGASMSTGMCSAVSWLSFGAVGTLVYGPARDMSRPGAAVTSVDGLPPPPDLSRPAGR
jgi:hypothetical protein